ncbi:TetR/AcrR family transcriptional regulator [Conexibacter sp. DBS9H8]|uniref:TetR/AcrR family transcriptional regulator n=1 Tax=Conexibacter sp. DBS9H8 TaxID=2937801 RepID=UPI0021118B39|nr:TetR/AcrR family transcriptional regulator [Conexibacter sp. DBS9H8]
MRDQGHTSDRGQARRRLPASERRDQLIAAARRAFAEGGFSGTRVSDISKAAGVNDALLYRHFESKEALFDAAIVEPLHRHVELLLSFESRAGEALSGDRDAYVTDLLVAVLEAAKDLAPLLGVMLYGGGGYAEPFYTSQIEPAIERFAAAIEAHDEEWEHADFSARLLVQLAIGACLMIAAEERLSGKAADAERIRELAEFLQAGLAPRVST